VALIAGILGYVFKGKIAEQVKMGLETKLNEYDPRSPSVVSQAWDDMQTKVIFITSLQVCTYSND
jgi:hypothetical protein